MGTEMQDAEHSSETTKFDETVDHHADEIVIADIIRKIDTAVEGNKLADAYRYAMAHVEHPSVTMRYLLLDFWFREEWLGYETFLEGLTTDVDLRFASGLKSFFYVRIGRTYAISTASREDIFAAGIPHIYGQFLEFFEPLDLEGSDKLKSLRRRQVWRSLSALEAQPELFESDRKPSVLVIYDLSSTEMTWSHFPESVKQITNAGFKAIIVTRDLGVAESATAAGASVLENVSELDVSLLEEGSYVVYCREPVVIVPETFQAFPFLLGDRPHTAIKVGSALDKRLDSFALSLSADFIGRPPVLLLAPGQPVEQELVLSLNEEDAQQDLAYAVVAPSDTETLNPKLVLVIYKGTLTEKSMLTGSYSPVFIKCEVGESLDLDFVFAKLAENGVKSALSHDTPCFILTDEIRYPPSYLVDMLHIYERCDRSHSVAGIDLAYNHGHETFSIDRSHLWNFKSAALNITTCLRWAELESLLKSGLFSLSPSLIDLPHPGFFLTTKELSTKYNALNQRAFEEMLAYLAGSVDEKHKAFHARGRLEILQGSGIEDLNDETIISSIRPELLRDKDLLQWAVHFSERSRLNLSLPMFNESVSKMVALTERNRFDLAMSVLRNLLKADLSFEELSVESLDSLISASFILGLQQDLNARVLPYIPLLAARYPDKAIKLFELAASCVPKEILSAQLIAAVHFSINGKYSRTLYRLQEVAKRYCDSNIMISLLFIIDASQHSDILRNASFAASVGEAILYDELDFLTPKTRCDRSFFIEHAPIRSRILKSVIDGDRLLFVTLMNSAVAQYSELAELISALRTYTYELLQFQIEPDEIPIYLIDDQRQKLMLALLFGHHEKIEQLQKRVRVASAGYNVDEVISSTYLGNFDPLNFYLKVIERDDNVIHQDIQGKDIYDLFSCLSQYPQLDAVEDDRGTVSVIMTVFNPDIPLLKLAIQSVLRQSYRNLELILVDDATDNGDTEMIRRLTQVDPRIQYLKAPRNSGPYVCRNMALDIARGRYIAIQDGDDYSHPGRIATQVKALQKNRNLVFCTSSHLRIDRNARLQYEHNGGLLGDGTMTSFFRREVFDQAGRFVYTRSRGDVEFRERLMRYFGTHTYTHIRTPLVYCFATPASLSNTTSRTLPHYLQLFRSLFAQRHRSITSARRPVDVYGLSVPLPMRAL